MPGLRQVGEATSLLCCPWSIHPSSPVEVLLNQVCTPKAPQTSSFTLHWHGRCLWMPSQFHQVSSQKAGNLCFPYSLPPTLKNKQISSVLELKSGSMYVLLETHVYIITGSRLNGLIFLCFLQFSCKPHGFATVNAGTPFEKDKQLRRTSNLSYPVGILQAKSYLASNLTSLPWPGFFSHALLST